MVPGDAGQEQPFSQQTGKIMQLTSALDNSSFIRNTYHYHLNGQHRVADVQYAYYSNPDNTILTFTKNAANDINDIVIKAIFNDQQR